jgi:hypothetical protein
MSKKNEQPTSARITKQEQQNSDQKVSNITNSSTLDQSGVVYSFITIYLQVIIDHLLVAGFSPSEKHESQLVLLFPIYIYIWKVIKIMFQTTNQPQIVFPNGAQREGFTGKRDRDLRRDSTNTKSVHYYWFLLVDKQENHVGKKHVIYNLSQPPFVGGKSSSKPDVGIYVGGRVGDKMGTRDELVLIILPVLTYRTPKKTGRQDGIRYR